MTQLQLLPDKPVKPKFRKVVLSDLPEHLPGSEPDKAFIRSVERFDVLQPVGLIEADRGLLVAFGRRRIKAARRVGLISIPALIYPANWTPEAVLTLVENQQRKDNLVAKLEAVEELRLIATPEEICSAVGITKPELDKVLKLIAALIPQLRTALAEGRMSATTAYKAIKLSTEQQLSLAELDLIKAKDVDSLIEANASTRVQELPESLFDAVRYSNWQSKANQLVEQLLVTVPEQSEYHAQLQQIAKAIAQLESGKTKLGCS